MANIEFRCCVEHEGCGDQINCPYDLAELFSHLKPGETDTAMCNKAGELVSIYRIEVG